MVALSFYKHKHNLWVSKKTMRPPVLRDKRDKRLISQGETWTSLISKYKDRDRTYSFILTVDSILCMMQYAPGLFLMTEAANLWRLLGFIKINKINCKNWANAKTLVRQVLQMQLICKMSPLVKDVWILA